MRRTVQTTYHYRLDPTAEQVNLLNQFAGARRFIWNWALARKREHFRQTGKTLSYNDLAAELTRLKQQPATAWLREIDSQSLQQALRDLESAYQHFFRRVRNGDKKKGFPKFKSKKTDTPRFRVPQRVVLQDGFVSVPKIGLKVSRKARRSSATRADIGTSVWSLSSRAHQLLIVLFKRTLGSTWV